MATTLMKKPRKPVEKHCVHHWKIEPCDGNRFSGAVCKKCGAETTYDNFPERNIRDDQLSGHKSSGGWSGH